MYWYILLFFAILYYYVEFWLVLFYSGAWEGELTTPTALTFSIIFLLVLIVDIAVQLNTGFITKGITIYLL